MTNAHTANPYPPAPAAPTGNTAGTAAFVIGVIVVGAGVLQQVLAYTLPLWIDGIGGYGQIDLVFTIVAFVSAALAITGVIVGVVGIQPSRTRGRLAAAAGLALSAAHLLGTVVGVVLPLVVGLLA